MAPGGCYLRVQDLAEPDGLYQLQDRIAEGTYGEIYAATEKSSGDVSRDSFTRLRPSYDAYHVSRITAYIAGWAQSI